MAACASLLCDHCRLPGRCCTGFRVNAASMAEAETGLHALIAAATIATFDCHERPLIGVPFSPLYRHPERGWSFWCAMLGRDGRCLDYQHRPSLCRDYQPGVDELCAEHRKDAA